MKCEKCGVEYPHKIGRFCGTCLPSYRGDVRVQIEKDCELCGGIGVVNETPDYSFDARGERVSSAPTTEIDCPRCTGTGRELEWIGLSALASLLNPKDTPWKPV